MFDAMRCGANPEFQTSLLWKVEGFEAERDKCQLNWMGWINYYQLLYIGLFA